MIGNEIIEILKRNFPDAVVEAVADGPHPHVQVNSRRFLSVCEFLKTDAHLRFDFLRCVTAIDWPAKNALEASYDLLSTSLGHVFAVKVALDRNDPTIPSASAVWPAAEWHEREAWDLLGVKFTDHPDPTRILMPDDWVGHPLRKDYQDPESYHGLKINP